MSGAELRIPVLALIIIVGDLAGILAVGVLSTRKQKLTGDAYFLAGRSLGWVVIGAALFASNISTIHLVGLAASGYNEGLVWGNFEWAAGSCEKMLGQPAAHGPNPCESESVSPALAAVPIFPQLPAAGFSRNRGSAYRGRSSPAA